MMWARHTLERGELEEPSLALCLFTAGSRGCPRSRAPHPCEEASLSIPLPARGVLLPAGQVTVVVLLTPPHTVQEIVLVSNGLQQVSLHQANVVQLRGGNAPGAAAAPLREHLGINNGVSIVQTDVVVDEDVVNAGIMGVDPQGLPTSGGELISGPPVKVVLEASDSLKGAEVVVQLSPVLPGGQALCSPCQHHLPLAAAYLPRGEVHRERYVPQGRELGVLPLQGAADSAEGSRRW